MTESNNIKKLIDLYQDDLPSPETIEKEVHIRRMKWDKVAGPDRPDAASKALEQVDSLVFPNIHCLLLESLKRSYFALKSKNFFKWQSPLYIYQ